MSFDTWVGGFFRSKSKIHEENSPGELTTVLPLESPGLQPGLSPSLMFVLYRMPMFVVVLSGGNRENVSTPSPGK